MGSYLERRFLVLLVLIMIINLKNSEYPPASKSKEGDWLKDLKAEYVKKTFSEDYFIGFLKDSAFSLMTFTTDTESKKQKHKRVDDERTRFSKCRQEMAKLQTKIDNILSKLYCESNKIDGSLLAILYFTSTLGNVCAQLIFLNRMGKTLPTEIYLGYQAIMVYLFSTEVLQFASLKYLLNSGKNECTTQGFTN